MDVVTNGPPLAPWYLTGLIDGCGVLTYSTSGRTRQLTVVFAVRTVPEHRAILDRIRAFFTGAGRIYGARPRGDSGTAPPGCLLRIVRPIELLRVVRHLDEFPLQGPRAGSYAIWREMVVLRAAYHRAAAPEELFRLARTLSAAARSSGTAGPGIRPS